MVFSTSKSTAARRTVARVAVAGAIAVVPLTALAIPASADAGASAPTVTEVRHDRGDHRDRDWFRDKHRCNDNWWYDDCKWDDRGRGHNPIWPFSKHVPSGSFGSF